MISCKEKLPLNVRKFILKHKSIKNIIIHECHYKYISRIKNLLNITKSQSVWIINTLPLQCYLEEIIDLNKLSSILNTWMNINSELKKTMFNSIENIYV